MDWRFGDILKSSNAIKLEDMDGKETPHQGTNICQNYDMFNQIKEECHDTEFEQPLFHIVNKPGPYLNDQKENIKIETDFETKDPTVVEWTDEESVKRETKVPNNVSSSVQQSANDHQVKEETPADEYE